LTVVDSLLANVLEDEEAVELAFSIMHSYGLVLRGSFLIEGEVEHASLTAMTAMTAELIALRIADFDAKNRD
jgi:hypothetical protein